MKIDTNTNNKRVNWATIIKHMVDNVGFGYVRNSKQLIIVSNSLQNLGSDTKIFTSQSVSQIEKVANVDDIVMSKRYFKWSGICRKTITVKIQLCSYNCFIIRERWMKLIIERKDRLYNNINRGVPLGSSPGLLLFFYLHN